MEVAIGRDVLFAEGPRWDAATRRLLWVDIQAGALHVFDPVSGSDRAIPLGSPVGAAAPMRSGEVLVGLADRLAAVDLTDESVRTLVEIPHGPELRLNDGACDPAGRFWVGSIAFDETPGAAALYRYNGALERMLSDVTISNGLGWTADGQTMYYVDSLTYRIDVFDFDVPTGAISGRRQFASIDPADGIPDGLALDDDGGVWIALFGGGAVRRYDSDGTLDRIVEVPAEKVTACCFGGDDGRSLFITTASALFVTDVGISGPPAQPFHVA
jgi:sugar lactone lactonase YvrE